MKNPTTYLLITFLLSIAILSKAQERDLVNLVNPLMGTDSSFEISNGNTYPAIACPFGMNFWSPYTGEMGNGWMYSYGKHKLNGIKQTHQPSPWINDYAAFSFMPVTGELKWKEKDRASWFSHKAEVSKPHYYSVYLSDYDVTVEVTPTERAAMFRYTFPEKDNSYIILDAFHEGSMVKIIPEERKIIGYCQNYNHKKSKLPDSFHNYFVATFDKDFEITKTWSGEKLIGDTLFAVGEHTGAIVGFKTHKDETVHVKVASSFISPEQAELNLKREIGKKDFETVKKEAQKSWNKELNRIQIEGGDFDQQRTFYSCLYRMLLFPRKFYEYDKDNQIVHYSPYNGEVLPGYMFTDNGFWDTFRGIFPFFTLMYPTMNSQIMRGLVNTYKEGGWLPEWASPGYAKSMIGSNSAAIIADSYMKGIRGYDIETLYEAIIKNTKGHGPIVNVGRWGAEYYNELGYVPYDVNIIQNASRTLEYAYDDFCIWQLAQELGKSKKEVNLFAKRSQNFNNLFHPEHKLMCAKNVDGSFKKDFDPFLWQDEFTEGCSWHYTWSVFQDIERLKNLMGGREAFVSKLDSIFSMPPIGYHVIRDFEMHEIVEMKIANFGNYAHGNQPIQHMIYLYNYAGEPWKAQKWNREILTKLYNYTPDGYCGDEDNGQTSAWYVLSSLGFYSVCPGTDEYVFSAPLFKKATMTFEDGKKLTINAPENNVENIYIQKMELNGKVWDKNYITHSTLQNGGTIDIKMSNKPNYKRGTSKEAEPYSMSKDKRYTK